MKNQLFAHLNDRDVIHLLAFIGGYIDATGWYLPNFIRDQSMSVCSTISYTMSISDYTFYTNLP
jgi:hypothetical protein